MAPAGPQMTINIAHLPKRECRLCKSTRFKAEVEIRYNPLSPENFIVPVYTCANCGELLDLAVTPKKHK